jgi:dCMP deaminase
MLSHEAKWLRACAMLAPVFSTCSRRQYFSVVVGTDKRVVGVGYNGSPSGMKHCVDGGCPRGASGVAHGSTYSTAEGFCIAQHAEAGALLHSDPTRRRGGTVIVNGPPCFECARLIASSGVARLVCLADEAYEGWGRIELFLNEAGIEVVVGSV